MELRIDLNRIIQDRNLWLFIIFVIYLLSIVIFAIIYFLLYKRYPLSFAFNADILRNQSESFRLTTEKAIGQMEEEINAFSHLLEELDTRIDPMPKENISFGSKAVLQTSQYNYRFIYEQMPSGPAAGAYVLMISISDRDGKHVSSRNVEKRFPEDIEAYRELASSLIEHLEGLIQENNRRLKTLSSVA
jgi:hypothetical protein